MRALHGPASPGQLGETVLEITTGTFDHGATPPGNLTMVQIEQVGDGGRVRSSRTFDRRDNGDHAQYVLQNVLPGAMLQVQAQVRGTGRSRTNVITVWEEVKRRPDLAASDLQAPARAVPHAPVTISALVRELNGDVGARADCVLFVDAVEVDRARSIWVDAGSAVNCAFSHSFAAEGTLQLTVAVQRVTPGDWNTANNAVTGRIEIGGVEDFYFEASARAFEARYRVDRTTHRERFSRSTGTRQWTQEQTDVSENTWVDHQHAEHVGWMPVELRFPLALLEMEHSTAGTTLASLQRTAVAAQWVDSFTGADEGYRYTCASDYSEGVNVTHLYVDVCTGFHYLVTSGVRHEFPYTGFSHYRWAGEVTFLSGGFYQRRFGDGSNETSVWFSNGTQQGGPVPPMPLGATYTLSFAVQGSEPAARTYRSTAVVPLDRVHVPWWIEAGLGTDARLVRSLPCIGFTTDEGDFYDVWRVCDVLDDYEAGRSGFVSNVPPVFLP